MAIKRIFLFCCLCFIYNCKSDIHLSKIEGKRIAISDSLASDSVIEAYIKPYREHVNKNLDTILAYSKDTYSKSDGHLNTAIGNFIADAVFEQSNPIFFERTGKHIDMVLLNHGGIRSIISKGNVTARTAFEVMPFENSTVVVAMKGAQIKEMLNYLSRAKRAHPISKLKIVLNKDYSLNSAYIKEEPIENDKTYYVATNDYLYNGGDRMVFFKPNDSVYALDYKIRNVLIDHFKKIDTVNPVIDDRFTQLNH